MTSKQYIDKQLDIYIRKNRDYGNSFYKSIEKYSSTAYYVRAEDKINRLIKLVNSNEQYVKDEAITDTVDDLFNYSAMYVAYTLNVLNVTTEDVRLAMENILESNFVKFLIAKDILDIKEIKVIDFINKHYSLDS